MGLGDLYWPYATGPPYRASVEWCQCGELDPSHGLETVLAQWNLGLTGVTGVDGLVELTKSHYKQPWQDEPGVQRAIVSSSP